MSAVSLRASFHLHDCRNDRVRKNGLGSIAFATSFRDHLPSPEEDRLVLFTMAACVYYKNNKNIKWQSCLSDEILTAIKERDRLKEELEKGQIQRMSFNAARNKVVRLIKKAKKEAVINKKDNSKLNSRVLWRPWRAFFLPKRNRWVE